MNLHDIHQGIKKHKRGRRVGRGPGSGHGKTSGRGHKGQGQLAGWSAHPVFQGGQMPLVRRIPKRGFNNQWALTVASINVAVLAELFQSGEEVTPESLQAKGLLKKRFDLLKILGHGDLSVKLKVSAHRFSRTAREKIEKAGGEVVVLAGRQAVSERSSDKPE